MGISTVIVVVFGIGVRNVTVVVEEGSDVLCPAFDPDDVHGTICDRCEDVEATIHEASNTFAEVLAISLMRLLTGGP